MTKTRLFIRDRPTVQLRYMDFGLLRITERLMTCLPVMGFYLIMNRLGGERPL